MAKKLPQQILVYECDTVDGEPIYAVALSVDDIPEEYDNVRVGAFVLNREHKFNVKRALV